MSAFNVVVFVLLLLISKVASNEDGNFTKIQNYKIAFKLGRKFLGRLRGSHYSKKNSSKGRRSEEYNINQIPVLDPSKEASMQLQSPFKSSRGIVSNMNINEAYEIKFPKILNTTPMHKVIYTIFGK